MTTKVANGAPPTTATLDNGQPEESRPKKGSEAEKENRKQAALVKQHNRQMEQLRKEKDNLQQDYNRAVLAKSQLESLCRELQRQNRTISEESLVKLKEEEEKRKETQASFQKQINNIMTMIKDNKVSNDKLQEEKVKMSQHFKYLVDQTQAKQLEIEKIDKQMELAMQLSDAKLAKVQMEAALDKESMLKEKHDLLSELKVCRQELGELQARDKSMQGQLSMYTDKYQEFQSSFAKSNDIFTTYKAELEKMSKKVVKLEKEAMTWKLRFEKSNVTLLEMASEKQVRDQILSKTTRQLAQLQKLCRTFQAERTVLMQALQENNIPVPPMPVLPNEPLAVPELPQLTHANDDKLNAMTKNCADLKETLAQLQSQLTTISDEQKPEKKVKAKNKKKSKAATANGDDKIEESESKPESNEAVPNEEQKVVESEQNDESSKGDAKESAPEITTGDSPLSATEPASASDPLNVGNSNESSN